MRPANQDRLTPEQQVLLLDLTQIALDIAGIFEPTPFADLTNASISALRSDWTGAGISLLGTIPYVGDAAKAGKFPRYLKVVESAVVQAQSNARFAERVRPLLARVANAIDALPLGALPTSVAQSLRAMRKKLDGLIPAPRLTKSFLRKFWRNYLRTIQFDVPTNAGALWTKLPQSAAQAEAIAKSKGLQTLEMNLAKTDFFKIYEKHFGSYENAKAMMLDDLTDEIWKEVSLRFTDSLSGKVTAFVDNNALMKALSSASLDPKTGAVLNGVREGVFIDELWDIASAMERNPRITSVEVRDVAAGSSRLLTREAVLRSAASMAQ
jgi:hypothetical protein